MENIYEEVIDERVEILPMSEEDNSDDNSEDEAPSEDGENKKDDDKKKPIRPEPIVGSGGLSLDKPEEGE